MMKDRILKITLLRYFLRNFWYSELEVNILSKERISSSRKLITDIDVLALYPDNIGDLKLYLGDCKTLKNQSPIARVLWMRGLLDYINAPKGIIVLMKDIEKEHQLSAHHLNVQLYSDSDFDTYAKRMADYSSEINCALGSEENWTEFLSLGSKFPRLVGLLEYARTNFWNESNSRQQLRTGIHQLKTNKGELNPANRLHLAVVLNQISLIAIALNNVIIHLFNKYLIPTSKEDLDNDMKVLIYGGIENYEFLNELRKKFGNLHGDDERDLSLPEWGSFLELIRTTLEKPLAFNLVPLFLKEIAFTFIPSRPQIYNYAQTISRKDNYISTFSIRLIEYICRACNLPPEFKELYLQEILAVTK